MKRSNELYNFFFSFLYFGYQKIGEKGILGMPGFYALCLLTVFESFNVISLAYFGMFFLKVDKQHFQDYYAYPIVFTIMGLNYIYFYMKKQKEVGIAEYASIPAEKRRKFKIYFLCYIAATVIAFIVVYFLFNHG